MLFVYLLSQHFTLFIKFTFLLLLICTVTFMSGYFTLRYFNLDMPED